MIYLFTQDREKCVPFNTGNLEICGSEIRYSPFYNENTMIMASYISNDEAKQIMKDFSKKVALGYETYVFPTEVQIRGDY